MTVEPVAPGGVAVVGDPGVPGMPVVVDPGVPEFGAGVAEFGPGAAGLGPPGPIAPLVYAELLTPIEPAEVAPVFGEP